MPGAQALARAADTEVELPIKKSGLLRASSSSSAVGGPSLPEPPKLWEKLLYGLGASFGFNALVVTNGIVLDYYEDVMGLSTAFLSLTTFLVGILTIFTLIGFGYASDITKSRYGRRKPYIAGER